MSERKTIFIVAAVIQDTEGRVLLVRKKETRAFMHPGGKKESHEDDLTALSRELLEELGCKMDPTSARFLGLFQAQAANEPDHIVEAAIYQVDVLGNVLAQAEIEEIIWVHPASPGEFILAPLTRDYVLPLIAGTSRRTA